MTVSQQPEDVSQKAFFPLLKLAGFNPHSHSLTLEFRTAMMGPVDNLIGDLNSSKSAKEKLTRLNQVSSTIAAHFIKNGFFRYNETVTAGEVEAVLRENLGQHVNIPPALRPVSS